MVTNEEEKKMTFTNLVMHDFSYMFAWMQSVAILKC